MHFCSSDAPSTAALCNISSVQMNVTRYLQTSYSEDTRPRAFGSRGAEEEKEAEADAEGGAEKEATS